MTTTKNELEKMEENLKKTFSINEFAWAWDAGFAREVPDGEAD